MTTINATKGELVNLVNGLFSIQELKGKKFGIVVSKNLTTLEEKLKQKDYSPEMEVKKKERKKPKRRQNQIFILPK